MNSYRAMVNCMQTSVFLPKICTMLQIIKIGICKYNRALKVAFLKSSHKINEERFYIMCLDLYVFDYNFPIKLLYCVATGYC